MTPTPEQDGGRIYKLFETQRQIEENEKQINQIFKNAVTRANEIKPAVLVGIIGEREISSDKRTAIDLFYPVIRFDRFHDPFYYSYPSIIKKGINALAGVNFGRISPVDLNAPDRNATVDWGGKIGQKKYLVEDFYSGPPFTDFTFTKYFTRSILIYHSLVKYYENLNQIKRLSSKISDTIESPIPTMEKGDIASYLLPSSLNQKRRLELSGIILSGLNNATDTNPSIQPKNPPTVSIIHPGEESIKIPSKEKLLVFPQVKFKEFLLKIANKGFTNFTYLKSRRPGQHIDHASEVGFVEMVFTDSSIPDSFEGVEPADLLSNYRPHSANYVAHIKEPPREYDLIPRFVNPSGRPLPQPYDPTQVLIIGKHKFDEVRNIFNQIEGLQDVHITFNSIR